MNKNLKIIFSIFTLVMLLSVISAVYATDIDDLNDNTTEVDQKTILYFHPKLV